MRLDEALTLILICLPAIYTTLRTFSAFEELNLFLIIGFISLLLSLDLLAEVALTVICTSTFTSLAFMFLGNPTAFMSLSSGYIISSSLVLLISVRHENKPHTRLSMYLASLLISMKVLWTLQHPLTPYTFLERLFLEWPNPFSPYEKSLDQTFLILIAPSVIGILSTISPSNPSIISLILNREPIIAILLAILPLLLISTFSGDVAWIISIILALMVTMFFMVYLKVVK